MDLKPYNVLHVYGSRGFLKMIDVVISTYNKSTLWTDAFDPTKYRVIKYTKNTDQHESPTNLSINQGFEASTYLKHIVENYDCLTDTTAFLHDEEYSWHHHGSIVQLVEEHTHETYFNLNSFIIGTILNNVHFNTLIHTYYDPYLKPYIGPYSAFGDWTMGQKGCAQYMIDKRVIQSKPKVMYENLLKWILEPSNDPSVDKLKAQFMEWTWDIIFLKPLI